MYIGMRVYGTFNNIFIISKQISLMVNYYTKVLKGINQINNMLHKGTGRNKLRTVCGCLHSTLFIKLQIH